MAALCPCQRTQQRRRRWCRCRRGGGSSGAPRRRTPRPPPLRTAQRTWRQGSRQRSWVRGWVGRWVAAVSTHAGLVSCLATGRRHNSSCRHWRAAFQQRKTPATPCSQSLLSQALCAAVKGGSGAKQGKGTASGKPPLPPGATAMAAAMGPALAALQYRLPGSVSGSVAQPSGGGWCRCPCCMRCH